MERLQKVMAERGVASRRKCEEYIRAGRVRVNGKQVTELGVKVNPFSDRIEVDGKLLENEERVYILLHKPAGVITSARDPQGRRTVLDLLKRVTSRVYPVGRLDYETEGLLLLTNDGELANRVMHPRYEIEKEYRAYVQGKPTPEALEQLRNGVKLEDGVTSPAEVALIECDAKGNSWLSIILHEGKNRQVRRMCAQVGFPVIYLKRVRLGFLTLGDLKKGEYRRLTEAEIIRLKSDLGL
jgi:23S rRNA pseudouridine2605 synthase